MLINLEAMPESWISELCAVVSDNVQAINEIWDAIGIEGRRLQTRKETLHSHVCSLLDDMYDEELVSQRTMEASIANLINQINELENELDVPHFSISSSDSLSLTEKALYDRFKTLEERAVTIKETYDSLRKEEVHLSERLDEPSVEICFLHVPNRDQMHALKSSIDKLTLEKRSRLLQLTEYRQYILRVCAAIDVPTRMSTCNLLSQLKLEDALESLPLSKHFLIDVECVRAECEKLFSEVQSDFSVLVSQINCLAGRLSLVRDDFLDVDQPVSSRFLLELREELQRLTELRRSNLSVLIRNCRTELQDVWDACRLADHDRKSHLLTDVTGDEFCKEKCLEILETEIGHWKEFNRKYEEVLESLEAWEVTFFKFREIELKKNDPVILKNRGGILLKVEKEYKQAQRDLKRLSSHLQQLVNQQSYSNLLVHGLPVMEFLDASQSRYEMDKENEAKHRKAVQLKPKQVNAVQPGATLKHTLLNKRTVTNKPTMFDESSASSSSVRSKKPRMDVTKTPLSRIPANKQPRIVTGSTKAVLQTPNCRTPVHKFQPPSTCPPKSVQRMGALTSTPRHSREFMF